MSLDQRYWSLSTTGPWFKSVTKGAGERVKAKVEFQLVENPSKLSLCLCWVDSIGKLYHYYSLETCHQEQTYVVRMHCIELYCCVLSIKL